MSLNESLKSFFVSFAAQLSNGNELEHEDLLFGVQVVAMVRRQPHQIMPAAQSLMEANIKKFMGVVEEQNDGEGGAQMEVLLLSINGFCYVLI